MSEFIAGSLLCGAEHEDAVVDLDGRTQLYTQNSKQVHLVQEEQCLSIYLLPTGEERRGERRGGAERKGQQG